MQTTEIKTSSIVDKRMERIARKVEFYLWVLFVNFLLMAILVPRTWGAVPGLYYRSANWVSYIWVLLILKTVFENFKLLFHFSYLRNRLFKLYKPFLLFIGLGLFTGFLFSHNKTQFYRPLVWDFLPMFCAAFGLLGGGCIPFRERFFRMIAWQSIIAAFFTTWVMFKYPVLGKVDFLRVHYMTGGLLWPCLLAFASLRNYSLKLQIGIAFSFAVWLLLTLSYQSRGGFIIAFVLFPSLLIISYIRKGIVGSLNLKVLLAIMAIGFGLYFLLTIPVVQERIEFWYADTMNRLFMGKYADNMTVGFLASVGKEYTTSRGVEATEFVRQADIFTWLIGRGYGSGWESALFDTKNWGIVHIGPLHLVLKGGLPLSILFLILVCGAIKRAWKNLRVDPWAISFLCASVLYFVGFLKHGPIGHAYMNYIFWLVLGMALASGNPRRARPLSPKKRVNK